MVEGELGNIRAHLWDLCEIFLVGLGVQRRKKVRWVPMESLPGGLWRLRCLSWLRYWFKIHFGFLGSVYSCQKTHRHTQRHTHIYVDNSSYHIICINRGTKCPARICCSVTYWGKCLLLTRKKSAFDGESGDLFRLYTLRHVLCMYIFIYRERDVCGWLGELF